MENVGITYTPQELIWYIEYLLKEAEDTVDKNYASAYGYLTGELKRFIKALNTDFKLVLPTGYTENGVEI